MDLSVLIVNYNTRDLTCACLESVFEQTRDIEFEVILVDNASTDGSVEAIQTQFPQVTLIAEQENLGFGRANNLAGAQARGEYVLLLNSDTVVLDGALQKLVAFARKHPDAGICGGRTVFADGRLNATSCWGKPTLWSEFCIGTGLSKLFRNSSLFNPRVLAGWDRDTERPVDVISGCFLQMPRQLWDELEGFDPRFFMYGEDVDLNLRVHAKGKQCMFCPDAEIIHYGGKSEKMRAEKMIRLFRAKTQLYRKHWSSIGAATGVGILRLWSLTRLLGFTLLRPVRGSAQASLENWRTVWRNRREWQSPKS